MKICTPDITLISRHTIDEILDCAQSRQEQIFFSPRLQPPISPVLFKNVVRSRFDPTLILIENKVVAHANFINTGKICTIGNLIVHYSYRRKGLAAILISHLEKIAIEKYKTEMLAISCFDENLSARTLFKTLKFEISGTKYIDCADGNRRMLFLFNRRLDYK